MLPPTTLSGQLWSTWHSAYLPVVVNTHEGQGGPGQLHGLEVDGGARGPRALDSWLIHGAWGGGAVEDGHGLQRQPVHDVDATVMEGQGQTWGRGTCRLRGRKGLEQAHRQLDDGK